MIRVVVLAAIPQESRPLLKLLGASRKLAGQPVPAWLQRLSHVELLVMESGMGTERAWQAARHVLSGSSIDLLVSMGFAGSLWPGFCLGQVVWSRELIACDDESAGGLSSVGFRPGAAPVLTTFCQGHQVRPARFLTVDRPRPKAGMIRRFAAEPTVVEMESTPVAAAAHGRHVAFLGLRAITDEATEEIGWDVGSVMDRAGRLSAPKVVRAVLRRPSLLRSLLRLRGSSRVAGRTLAATLVALLQLPEEDLLALVAELRLRPLSGGGGGEPSRANLPAGHA
jgi:adenosylhomocysteine nucleosidase